MALRAFPRILFCSQSCQLRWEGSALPHKDLWHACGVDVAARRPYLFGMAQTQLTWYGQSAFKIVTPGGKVLLIDPWITNPKNPNGEKDLAALERVDLIFLTHGHFDHVGNLVDIGKKTGARLVCGLDLATAVKMVLGYPPEQAQMDTTGLFGGEVPLLDGEITSTLVRAF